MKHHGGPAVVEPSHHHVTRVELPEVPGERCQVELIRGARASSEERLVPVPVEVEVPASDVRQHHRLRFILEHSVEQATVGLTNPGLPHGEVTEVQPDQVSLVLPQWVVRVGLVGAHLRHLRLDVVHCLVAVVHDDVAGWGEQLLDHHGLGAQPTEELDGRAHLDAKLLHKLVAAPPCRQVHAGVPR
jgi:hypothetical protein